MTYLCKDRDRFKLGYHSRVQQMKEMDATSLGIPTVVQWTYARVTLVKQ
jgi:hypothetical protein